ncbi:zinc finger protein 311-like [Sitodiplosis mosellana]|uniref:zinc finger protein 311-like n=1 Tax=Sitodiplosis mosellana TaxID=263140 RepID=UPI002443DF42|nr:zinc finger protein 311-like [Sitodiplosis mosellana]
MYYCQNCKTCVRMASISFKCFICDMPCVAIDKNRGFNIASTLAMPLSAVLEKCLRVVADVECEYFCTTCAEKIEEYDRLVWQSQRIEKELHAQFQNKSIKFEADDQRPIISNGIIWDRDRVNEVLIEMATGHNDVDVERKPNIELLNLDLEPQNGRDNEMKRKIGNDKNGSNKKFDSQKDAPILENKVSCDYCGRTYRSKSALSVHIVKHIDKNPFECNLCGKTFTQRGGMVRHMRIHSGERRHQCDVCGKRFIHTASFNVHKKIHAGERPKKCTVCGSNFRSNSHVARHMRTHTGEKPFKCEVCGQKFAQRYNLTTHQKTHERDQGEPLKHYKCLVCPETFIRREKLDDHLVQAHQAIETSISLGVFNSA